MTEYHVRNEYPSAGPLLAVESPRARLAIDPPRSRLARAIWRWFGVTWTVKP